MRFYSKQKTYLGIQATTKGIVFAECIHQQQGFCLNYLGAFSQEEEQKIADVLPGQCSFVFMSIPTIKVLKKMLYFDQSLTVEDVDKHIKIEGKNYFPDIQGTLCFDFCFSQGNKKFLKDNEIHLYAVKTEEILSLRAFASQLKLKLLAIEPECYSAIRLLTTSHFFESGDERTYIFLTKETSDSWRMLIFNQHIVFSDQILPPKSLKDRWLTPDEGKTTWLICSHYENDYREMIGSGSFQKDIQLVDPFKNVSRKPACFYYSNQVVLGLALRGHS